GDPEDTAATSEIPDNPAGEEDYQPADWVRQLLDETRQQFGIGGQEQGAIPDEERIPENAQPTAGRLDEGEEGYSGYGAPPRAEQAVSDEGTPAPAMGTDVNAAPAQGGGLKST